MRSSGEIVYVAVGANLGDREVTFARVIHAVERTPQVLLLAASPVFESEPVGPSGQGPYLNAVLELRTWLGPRELLADLQSIEETLGRDRRRESQRWGPRPVDLDILFYGDRCIEVEDLVIPHPRAHERAFVMTPMAEIASAFLHPKLGIAIGELARARPDRHEVRVLSRPPGWPGAPADPAR
ncbi:MAG: 2-amino-4-hydroxy-6-hydroxymethyldihydropteridine diphosphokinase [Deltaproteobacteria bacterium]|jgi:2-amino-4-hydroxy-6-hydroxymethyldihydropteridine diphosphokinase|nr:2-amino-4-hydroxy-6-hydroxymethyldihydropteridine diphosphokinase [Deltaproteobacteria bacterium]